MNDSPKHDNKRKAIILAVAGAVALAGIIFALMYYKADRDLKKYRANHAEIEEFQRRAEAIANGR